MSTSVPESRVHGLNGAPVQQKGHYVLYWMVATRRPRFNFALDRALAWARELDKPLVVLEALRVGYRWASERLHGFVLEGMASNRAAFADTSVFYYPYLEPEAGRGAGLLEALAEQAAVVVTDHYPAFFIPRMQQAVAPRLSVQLEAVDSNGLLPLSAARGRSFYSAYLFRRFVQANLEPELAQFPRAAPLENLALPRAKLPARLLARYPMVGEGELEHLDATLAALPIDHEVKRVRDVAGGAAAARLALQEFLAQRLAHYGDGRNHPDDAAASGLSPWLHFGHLSTHEVFSALAKKERWQALPKKRSAAGEREGFWGMSANAEAFLEELVTFRELAFNTAQNMPAYERYDSLPEWAQKTLREHAHDERPVLYDLATLRAGKTHDPVWNAAQRQLLEQGRIHNYLRMLWGKKVLEWSKTPEVALERLIELNNRYALDGRDPNSYAGISWIFGRYDRPWAPARKVFGTVRYMSSDSAKKKLHMSEYLARFGGEHVHA